MYGIEVTLKGIASLQNFIKFYHLVQMLERDGTQMDRRNDYLISLTFLSKGSALNIDSVPCSMVTLTGFSGQWLCVFIEPWFTFELSCDSSSVSNISDNYISTTPAECRCRVVKTPASYSGGPGFKSRPGDRLFWLRLFVVFLNPYRQMSG
jgi:hypothetical protein